MDSPHDRAIRCDHNRFSDRMFTGLNKSASCRGAETEDVVFFPLVSIAVCYSLWNPVLTFSRLILLFLTQLSQENSCWQWRRAEFWYYTWLKLLGDRVRESVLTFCLKLQGKSDLVTWFNPATCLFLDEIAAIYGWFFIYVKFKHDLFCYTLHSAIVFLI